jgi:hypothetical protein
MTPNPDAPEGGAPRPFRLSVFTLGCAATLAVVLLYAPWIAEPHIRYDDFNFLTKSRTLSETRTNLWQPMNEHVMPLTRLAAGALMRIVQRQSAIPMAAQVQGVLAVVLGMWLLYVFVQRELGHPFYGVMAMTLWGVTSTYYECVTWYSASFFTLALQTVVRARGVRRVLRACPRLPQHGPSRRPVVRTLSAGFAARRRAAAIVARAPRRGGRGAHARGSGLRGDRADGFSRPDCPRRALPG